MILKKQLQLSRALLPYGTGLRLMSTSKPGKGKLPAPAVSVKKPGTAAITRSHITINANKGKNLKLSLNSSPLLGLLTGQVLAIALYLGKRLPLLGMIGKILYYYLGKTSIWSLLVLSRKAFITINAIIGVFFVFKLTGVDITTILQNYSFLGNTYLEILQGLIKNSFNWIFDLLDLKIVPQDTPKGGSWFNPWNWGGGGGSGETVKDAVQSSSHSKGREALIPLKEILTNRPIPEGNISDVSLRKLYLLGKDVGSLQSVPWYTDYHTYLWLGGILLAGSLSLYGYSYFNPAAGGGPDANPLPDGSSILHLVKSVVRAFPNTWTMPLVSISSLNPMNLVNWASQSYSNHNNNLTTREADAQLMSLMAQRTGNSFSASYYPFTR